MRAATCQMTREGVVRVAGSKFIDGIGSTEMGHSAFQAVHRPGSNRYGRCVGKPYAFAEIALLDLDSGREVPDGQVGHVGLKSPTLAPGYWNDSVTTYRTRFGGYYLTGDLMYRDEDGYYYHVDRAVDAVDLGDGNWLYTALSEERILASCPDVRDVTVVAGQSDGQVVTDVLLLLAPSADPDDRSRRRGAGRARRDAAATLRRVVVVPEADIVTGPTGKVRKFLMRQRHLAGLGRFVSTAVITGIGLVTPVGVTLDEVFEALLHGPVRAPRAAGGPPAGRSARRGGHRTRHPGDQRRWPRPRPGRSTATSSWPWLPRRAP